MSIRSNVVMMGTLLLAGGAAPAQSRVQPAAKPAGTRPDAAKPAGSKSAGTKWALLIGINTYQPVGAPVRVPAMVQHKGRFAGAGPQFDNLRGPDNDVASMKALLTSAKFGFPDDARHLHVLEDGAATHDGILAAMKRYLVDEPAPGDTVVFYVAGHGSLQVNSKSDKQVYELEGVPTPVDNTIVPADAYLGAEDVLDRDLMRVFNQAADKGVHLTAILDTCHSGSQARGASAGPKMAARALAYDPRDLALAPDVKADGSAVTAPEDRKDNPVVVFSAAQEDQLAQELPDAAPPHGLFTAALVQALQTLPAGASANDVYRRVAVDMELGGARNQQPALDSTPARRRQPLLGGTAAASKARAAVVSVGDDGIVLDIGTIADIGTGSEFVTLSDHVGAKIKLRVTGQMGVTRSTAEVVAPAIGQMNAKDKVSAKDVVELEKWVPAPRPALTFYAGPANLSLAQIEMASAALHAAQLSLVSDPSREPWTHLVSWNGTAWTLQQAHRTAITELGATLDAGDLAKRIPVGSGVWFDAPLAKEVAQTLAADPASAVQLTSDRPAAMYVMAGAATDAGLKYAWYQRGDFDADVQTPKGFGEGCSPSSAYPLRTSWMKVDKDAGAEQARQLVGLATRLAKVNGWLQLEAAANSGSNFAYTLALQRVADQGFAESGGKTYKGDHFQLALQGDPDSLDAPRWVYVLGIDCQGKGELLYPQSGSGGRYPTESGRLGTIPLPGSKFGIGSPFGTDTYILLTTATPLPEPEALNFESVVRGGTRGASNPLEDLLQSTSAGTRGNVAEAPTDWGVQMLQLHSQPVSAGGGAP